MVLHIRHNFQITLPVLLRKRLGLSVGDILDTTVKEGKIVITPKKIIDADQAWFWSKEWQKGEKEARQDLKTGKVKKFKDADALIKGLDV